MRYVFSMGAHAKGPNWRRRGQWAAAVIAAGALTLTAGSLMTGGACALSALSAAGHRTGLALFFDPGPTGNCSLPLAALDALVASVSPQEYDGARACGGYLDVTGPRGTVRVQVVDSCPTCRTGEVDLSRAAFRKIARLQDGAVRVSYKMVRDPALKRTLAFRVKKGSTWDWLALQVLDHGNPLRSVDVRSRGGRWRALGRDGDGYWVTATGAGRGPFRVRVTDESGHRATIPDVVLAPGRIQRTTTRLYDPAAVAPVSATITGSCAPARPPSACGGTPPPCRDGGPPPALPRPAPSGAG